MSVNENININDPGNQNKKFPKKKIFNIVSTEIETRSRSTLHNISASDNNLSKESAAASVGTSNNNIDCDLSGENSRDDNPDEKLDDQEEDETESSPATEKPELTPETSVRLQASSDKHENIDVDDSDVISPASANQTGDNCEQASEAEPKGDQSRDKEEQPPKKGNNCELKGPEPIEVDKAKDDGGNTDEAKDEETQEYAMDTDSARATEDAHIFVDYKDADFDTDSDLDKWDSGDERKASHSKGAKKDMGLGSSKSEKGKSKTASAKKQKCQGSSSEEDSERPWLGNTKYNPKKKGLKQSKLPSSFQSPRLLRLKRHWSDHDTQMYRNGYPNKKDNPRERLNLLFYLGKIQSKPDGAFIDEFHEDWWHNHDRLESHHGYIQWLFPIRENGMNWHAQELQLHEAKAIREDKKMSERFVKSYQMMLYFYGIELVDRETGDIARADNWKQRFRHLNYSMHNYLRITRILKCLGELGLERYKAPFLRFMLHEAIVTGKLDRTLDSCYNYWIGTVKDDAERAIIKQLAEQWVQEAESKDNEDIDVGSD